jgi:hypothetical protein
LRPATLPHHRTCGFPHPAIELSGLKLPQDPKERETELPQNRVAQGVLHNSIVGHSPGAAATARHT